MSDLKGFYTVSSHVEQPTNMTASEFMAQLAKSEFVEVHHHDIEAHAKSFNEGYEAAMSQHLADDPSLAEDWLNEKLAEAWDEGAAFQSLHDVIYWNDNPYREA
jgi:hypothetical protein